MKYLKYKLGIFIALISLLLSMAVVFNQQKTAELLSFPANIKIGDYIQMGQYYDEPILWRCVDIDENGPLMLSDGILTIKPFDASGNHTYLDGTEQADYEDERTRFGSNLWETSNLRSWLNSTATAGNVSWLDGCPPSENNVWYGLNDYADEKGFLAEGNFTEKERNVIKPVTQKSLLTDIDVTKLKEGGSELFGYNEFILYVMSNYDEAYFDNVTDKMFLLDVKQLNKVHENSETLGLNYYIGKPTRKAVANSEYKNRKDLNVDHDWYYWLRTPNTYTSQYSYSCVRDAYISGGVYTIDGYNTPEFEGGPYSGEGCGVRPAFYIDQARTVFKAGNGTKNEPFVLADTIILPIKTLLPTETVTAMPFYITPAAITPSVTSIVTPAVPFATMPTKTTTQTPVPATPTPTPVAATPTPTPVPATLTPFPEPATPTQTPEPATPAPSPTAPVQMVIKSYWSSNGKFYTYFEKSCKLQKQMIMTEFRNG